MQQRDFRSTLLHSGLLTEGGVEGIYLRSPAFESVVRGVEAMISRVANVPVASRYFLPPIIPLSALEGAGYHRSFPNLVGVITSFTGSDSDLPEYLRRIQDNEEWTQGLSTIDISLCSAACHQIYPLHSHRRVRDDGVTYEVQASCFRHEPSSDPARMQSFRMQEIVLIGSEKAAFDHRESWLPRAAALLEGLGLDITQEVANDPFFGRPGRVLKRGQLEKELKFELLAPIGGNGLVAIASANYHEDHMGHGFDISLNSGGPAHSACMGFGLDRVALALISVHGVDLESWPTPVRQQLFASL